VLELSSHSLIDELRENCDAMARHALHSGVPVPVSVVAVSERARVRDPTLDLRHLMQAHDRLLRIVAPATPRTIRLLDNRPTGVLGALGPVRLIRHMFVAALILLALFILLASAPQVNTTSGDILSSSGWTVLVNELFYLAAGGIGAAFAALFRAYLYVAEGTYDPKYESSYWIRFTLGLIAGVLLPALVPVGDAASPVTRPVLALVGGFSAALVYTILQRLVDVVGSLFQGADGRPPAPMAPDPLTVSAGVERLSLVAELTKLGEQVRVGANGTDVNGTVDRLLRILAPELAAAPEAGDLPLDGPLAPSAPDGEEPGLPPSDGGTAADDAPTQS
jgi:hypothetical protein